VPKSTSLVQEFGEMRTNTPSNPWANGNGPRVSTFLSVVPPQLAASKHLAQISGFTSFESDARKDFKLETKDESLKGNQYSITVGTWDDSILIGAKGFTLFYDVSVLSDDEVEPEIEDEDDMEDADEEKDPDEEA